MDDLARAVLHIIAEHLGPDHYITRRDQLRAVNERMGREPEEEYKNDRPIRDAIEWLRANKKHGAYISAKTPTNGESGYFMARDEDEARKYMAPDWSRYHKLGDRLRKQEALLSGQLTVSDEQMRLLETV